MRPRGMRVRCCGCCLTMMLLWPAIVVLNVLFGVRLFEEPPVDDQVVVASLKR